MIKDFSFNALHLQRALTKEFMKLLYNIQSIPSFVASNHFVLVRDVVDPESIWGTLGARLEYTLEFVCSWVFFVWFFYIK